MSLEMTVVLRPKREGPHKTFDPNSVAAVISAFSEIPARVAAMERALTELTAKLTGSTLRQRDAINETQTSAHTFLRRRQVESRTGLARSTLYRKVAEGTFPKPMRLGPRSVGWLADEIETWIAARATESRPDASIV